MLRRHLLQHGEAVVLIAIGGIAGSNLRHLAGVVAGDGLLITLAVNALGSFLLGLLLFDARADELLSQRLRYIFATGFLASFTTYSTFIADIALTKPALAVPYLIGSYAAGFGGVVVSRQVISTAATTPISTPVPGEH